MMSLTLMSLKLIFTHYHFRMRITLLTTPFDSINPELAPPHAKDPLPSTQSSTLEESSNILEGSDSLPSSNEDPPTSSSKSFDYFEEVTYIRSSNGDDTPSLDGAIPIPRRTDRKTRKSTRLKGYYCSFSTSSDTSKGIAYSLHGYLIYKRLSTNHIDFLDKISVTSKPTFFA